LRDQLTHGAVDTEAEDVGVTAALTADPATR
jgi:hypothetical protein